MNKHKVKLFSLVALSLVTLFVMGCGGGGSDSPAPAPAKVAIAGTVSFPSLTSIVGKQVAKSVALLAAPTIELRNLNGIVVKSMTATGTGTTTDPFSYSFTNVDGTDYVVKAISGTRILKALVDKSSLFEATTRNVDTVSTTAVIVTEQKLGATLGTMGDTASTKLTSTAIAGVNPIALEGAINTAVGTVSTGAIATQSTVDMVNLVNIVAATVFSDVNTPQFIAGTVPAATISTTQYTYISSAPAVATTATVASSTVLPTLTTTATTYTAPPVDTVTFTSRVMDYSGTTAVAVSDVVVTANGLTTYTDASGYYTLAGIIKNTNFYVKMSKSGYADSYSAQMNIAANTNTSDRPYALWTPSTLTAWGNTTGQGVIRSRVVASTDLITGYIGGVVVTATDSSDGLTYPATYFNQSTGSWDTNLTSTDTNGLWMLTDIPDGKTVTVTASKAGYTFNTRTYSIHADSVSQGRLTGTASAVVTPPPTTDSSTALVFKSGMYSLESNWNEATYTDFYYINKISVATDGVHVSETNLSYLDPTSKIWTTTQPANFPSNSTDYTLTSSGWTQGVDTASNYSFVSNTDGSSITITNALSGSSAKLDVTSVSVAGQAVTTKDSDGLTLLTTAGTFPTGSLRYDMTWTQINDSYSLWDSFYVDPAILSSLTLDNIVDYFIQTGNFVYVDSNDFNIHYYAQFVGTGVNIYQEDYTTGTGPALIGTATFAKTTVLNQQFIEISIPSTLRTLYKLGGNPICAILPAVGVMVGEHSAPGISYSNGNGGYNLTAIDKIKTSIDTSLAKAVVSKKISKSILGF